MRTQTLIQKKEEFKDHQLKIGGLMAIVIFVIILYQYKKFKKNQLNQFLHSHDLTEIDIKTGNIIIPKLKIKKEKIIISKSNKINKKVIEEKAEAFEKFFNIQILEIEDFKQKTIIYIQK